MTWIPTATARCRASLFRSGYESNVAVSQPDLEGIRLLPTADFTFLRDVHRCASEPQVD